MATKMVCDKCGKELNRQPWWDIDATKWGAYGNGAGQYYSFDLCENCMKEVEKFIRGLN